MTLDLSLPSDEEPHPVQDRVSSLLRTSLYQRLDRIFTAFNDPKWHLKIDQLELDVGKISINRLETDLPERIEKELKVALLQLQQHNLPEKKTNFREQPAYSTTVEVLIFFLNNGSFPWWMPTDMRKEPVPLFLEILQTDSNALKELIGKVIAQKWPRKRMVYTFEETEIKQMVQLLDPINAEIITRYHEKLTKQHEKEAILKIGRQEFNKASWEVILQYLYEKRGSEFNQRNFLKQILRNLAVNFNLTFRELIEKLEAIALRFTASDQIEASLLKNIILLAQAEKPKLNQLPIAQQERLTPSASMKPEKQTKQFVNPFADFLEGKPIQWTEEAKKADTQLAFFQRLWTMDRPKAVLFMKQLVWQPTQVDPFIRHLPKEVVKELIARVQPELSEELWSIRNDLVRLLDHQSLPNLANSTTILFINRYFLKVALRSLGKGQPIKTILQGLLEQLAKQSDWTFNQLVMALLSILNHSKESQGLSSDLLVYLHQLHTSNSMLPGSLFLENASLLDRPTLEYLEITTWCFLPKQESIKDYLKRIKSWLRIKQKGRTIATIFAQPKLTEKWLPSLLAQWSMTDKMKLIQSLWPGLPTFFQAWVRDVHFLLQKFGIQRNIEVLPMLALELVIWQVLMRAGVGGLSKVNLVNASLNQLAISLKVDKTKLFHSLYTLSKLHVTQLTLKDALAPLIKKAIQRNLFVEPLPEMNPALAQKSLSFKILTHFFETGILPPGENMETIRSLIQLQLEKKPQLLRSWLTNLLQKRNRLERFCLFFAPNKQVQWLNFIETQAGTTSFDLLQYLKGGNEEIAKGYQGIRENYYWQLVWIILIAEQRKGFTIRNYLLEIVQRVLSLHQIAFAVFLEQLQKRSTEETASNPLIPFLLQVGFYLNLPFTTWTTSASMSSTTAKDWIFAEMTTAQLVEWLQAFFAIDSAAKLFDQSQKNKLTAFGQVIHQLSSKAQTTFWKILSDQTTFKFFQGLTTPSEFDAVLDVVEVIANVKRERQLPNTRLFSTDLSILLLNAIFDQRGSLSNQKSFVAKLLKDWANAHNMTLRSLMELLWPIVQSLSPIFHHHASLSIFSKVIQEEMGQAFVQMILPMEKVLPEQSSDKLEEEKPYRKLGESEEIPEPIDQVWTIHNAGLVLLWPYFNILFKRAGFMENGEFLDEMAQQKCVLLLEYLVAGTANPPEHLLVFNKVLCGYPVEAPIETTLVVEDSLQQLCEGLLQAAIQHWETLGKTTVPTFRETFLLREGNLARTQKHWQLQVNSKAYDLLLRQLPWGISTVNLSWLELVMKVDWE